jgi:hypothetical protein
MRYITICLLAFSLIGLSSTATAQEQRSEPEPSAEEPAEAQEGSAGGQESSAPADEKPEKPPEYMGPGTVDGLLSIGLGGLIFVSAEPGVDVGLVPIGNNLTLSVGGVVNMGFCLLCGIGSLAVPNFSIGITNISPQARALLHIQAIDDVDIFAGAGFGPSIYSLRAESNGVKLRDTITAWLFSGVVGGRYFPSDSFFGFAELRYQVETGFNTLTLDAPEWDTSFTFNTSYSRRGIDVILGGGLRF